MICHAKKSLQKVKYQNQKPRKAVLLKNLQELKYRSRKRCFHPFWSFYKTNQIMIVRSFTADGREQKQWY